VHHVKIKSLPYAVTKQTSCIQGSTVTGNFSAWRMHADGAITLGNALFEGGNGQPQPFLTVPAHCSINNFPTSVEPVKVNLRAIRFEVSSPPIRISPRHADALGQFAQAQCRMGSRGRRFQHHRTARGECGARLAGDHRRQEVLARA
jgi:hypothetical protein